MHLERRVRYAGDVACALDFTHTNCIVHLDIKPANIIITPKDGCKLGDYGCCQVIRFSLLFEDDSTNVLYKSACGLKIMSYSKCMTGDDLQV